MIVTVDLENELTQSLQILAPTLECPQPLVLDAALVVLLARYASVERVRLGGEQSAPELSLTRAQDLRSLCLRLATLASRDGQQRQVIESPERAVQGGVRRIVRDGLGGDLRLEVEFEAADDARLGDRIAGHVGMILQQVLARPQIPVGDLDILTPGEREEIVARFNDTAAPFDSGETLDRLFAERARHGPEGIALYSEHACWTFADLEAKSRALAISLTRHGVLPGDRVGVLLERSFDVVTSMLAAWQAGAAYFPLEPSLPEARLGYLLQQGRPQAVIAHEAQAVRRLGFTGPVVAPVTAPEATAPVAAPLPGPARSDDPACLLFTSGSTGEPKGVLIHHKAIHNGICSDQKQFGWGPGDVFLFKSSLSFITSLCETIAPLAAGAGVAVLPPGAQKDVEAVVRFIERHAVTHVEFAPGFLELFLEYVRYRQLWRAVSTLKVVFASGETLASESIRRFNETLHRHNGTSLYNTYGLTETSIDVTSADCSHEVQVGGSIGRPIDNVRLYVLDSGHRLQPVGVPGTLWVAGEDVLGRYLSGDEARFMHHEALGERLFNTGDRAAWMPDGSLRFFGREDSQVKIRGFRVDPAEVERSLALLPGVQKAAVVVKDGSLHAYVVPRGELSESIVREHLRGSLPEYMVPAFVRFLERLPENDHGKVDRRRLVAVEVGREKAGAAGVTASQDRLLARLCRLWSDLLGSRAFTIHDDFHDVGGNSLTAVLLQIRIEQEHGVQIPLREFFPRLTLAQLAEMVRARAGRRRAVRPGGWLSRRGDRPVLYCFPPVVGFGLFYQGLADALPEHSVYAFDFSGDPEYLQEYLSEMLKGHKGAPFSLLGYSAGGSLAFEAARALESLGLDVARVLLVDAERQAVVISRDDAELAREADRLFDEVVAQDFERLLFNDTARRIVRDRITTNLRFVDSMVNEGVLRSELHVIHSEGRDAPRGPEHSWRSATTGSYREYSGRGEHDRMLHGEHAGTNYAIIKGILRARSRHPERGYAS